MFQVVQTRISGWGLSNRLNNNVKEQNKAVEVASRHQLCFLLSLLVVFMLQTLKRPNKIMIY